MQPTCSPASSTRCGCRQKKFGPVATVIRFKDDDDALRFANGTVYSLAAGVWSADIARVHRFARQLKAGTVWINTYGPTDIRLPGRGAQTPASATSMATWPSNFTQPKVVWISRWTSSKIQSDLMWAGPYVRIEARPDIGLFLSSELSTEPYPLVPWPAPCAGTGKPCLTRKEQPCVIIGQQAFGAQRA